MIRVFLADDHTIMRHGIRLLLQGTDIEIVGEAEDGRGVLQAAGKDRWDVLILDVALPRVGGLEVLRRLLREDPALRVLVLSMYPEEQYAQRLVAEGARGYLHKTCRPETLIATIRDIAADRRPADTAAPAAPASGDERARLSGLTAREYQVFTLISQGSTVSEIAAELNLTASTVSTHLGHVRHKLGVRSVGEIVSYAHRIGLID